LRDCSFLSFACGFSFARGSARTRLGCGGWRLRQGKLGARRSAAKGSRLCLARQRESY
jgi:hypothetical protein